MGEYDESTTVALGLELTKGSTACLITPRPIEENLNSKRDK